MQLQCAERPGLQQGIALWQFIVVVLVAGFFALVTIKTVPLYLNELKVNTAVTEVAQKSGLSAQSDASAIRHSLQRHWDIDDIHDITPRDIGIQRSHGEGTQLSWDYDAKVHLFYNISIVIHFAGSRPMSARAG